MVLETTVLLDGLTFPTRPRWHDGKLWFVDIPTRRVMTVDLDGNAETIVEVPDYPGGLGWLPDGRLLVVSMRDRRLLRLDPGGLAQAADLSDLVSGALNNMVIDRQDRAYIGGIGFDPLVKWEPGKLAEIVLVTPDGDVRVVAGEIALSSGMVITPDGRTLIVAEDSGYRLTAFAIGPNGSLTGRHVWAKLGEGVHPYGICLDAVGAVWVASSSGQVLRVREGGEVTHRVGKTAEWLLACMLGGPDRRTLFVLETSQGLDPEKARAVQSGRIGIVQVDVSGAGLP
jgi:sugar lactone lactonase YvrE